MFLERGCSQEARVSAKPPILTEATLKHAWGQLGQYVNLAGVRNRRVSPVAVRSAEDLLI